ncbi:MAG TPA: hypothetical protein PLR25_21695, partial [Planctomycetaceae bacterium]|nr:hypothetical protein [Planctomycetaceae bacterium]
SGLSRVRGTVWFATLPDDIRESMTSAISDTPTSFRAEPKKGGESILRTRAAVLSEDGRLDTFLAN